MADRTSGSIKPQTALRGVDSVSGVSEYHFSRKVSPTPRSFILARCLKGRTGMNFSWSEYHGTYYGTRTWFEVTVQIDKGPDEAIGHFLLEEAGVLLLELNNVPLEDGWEEEPKRYFDGIASGLLTTAKAAGLNNYATGL